MECEKCIRTAPLFTISLWRKDTPRKKNITPITALKIHEEYHKTIYLCDKCLDKTKYKKGDQLRIVNDTTKSYHPINYLVSTIKQTTRVEYIAAVI